MVGAQVTRRALWLVLAAMAVPPAPAGAQRKSTGDPRLDREINRALDRGTEYLGRSLPHQQGGRLALVLFAALEGGAESSREEVRKALDRAIGMSTGETYTAGILLMLYRKHGGPAAREALARTAGSLLSWQGGDGGWGYGARMTRSDASNTQYALLGMRAAVLAGSRISRGRLQRAVRYLLRTRGEEGGFGYTTHRAAPRDTMTAGTLGSLEICRELAGRTGLGQGLEKKVEAASRLGVWWLERRFETSLAAGRRGVNMNRGYFLYALERAMILKGLEKLGRHAWYKRGAEYLVRLQERNGSWGEDPVTTAFAVLFLGRTFRTMQAETVASPEKVLLTLRKDASNQAVRDLAATLVERGLEAVPACLKVLRGKDPKRRRAAALALQGITGLEPGFDPESPPESEANQLAARAWERWWIRRRGERRREKGG